MPDGDSVDTCDTRVQEGGGEEGRDGPVQILPRLNDARGTSFDFGL